MIRKHLTIAVLAAAAIASAAPAMAQGIEIGRDGVRLVDPNSRNSDMRRDDMRRDDRRGREIGERDAVRIARAEGVREVDDVRRTSRSYRVIGTDRRGDDIQVDIDRRSGDVIGVR
ncbi:PepSY domain-containing protein [Aureimonas flava]|uniref:PepSY domain-containing protein n=1 Tax=Aureimonas flava TaxID=2320271 RepID=A0A3A1WJP2_9HYPH|nr:PepSY domain-containing protein [Aureimonas flava]RIY00162.1 PepSY domain-containing protein [Aureimonas flava]